jgi:hypothetical protein
MSDVSQSETAGVLIDERRETVRLSQVFDRDRSGKIGKHIEAGRVLYAKLGARVGIPAADVNAYEGRHKAYKL